MKNYLLFSFLAGMLAWGVLTPANAYAQTPFCKDSLLNAAREIVNGAPYCALASIDSTGQPQIRTMNPFPLSDGFVIWFATSRSSAKVAEIKRNPKVAVYFADHVKGNGYATITGNAEIIDDKNLLLKMKRDYWDHLPGWQDIFVLIKVTPSKIEVINYKHNFINDPKTFKAPSVVF